MIKNYINRSIEALIQKGIRQFPVLCLTGPRQSGKSTLLRKLFPNHRYITLDDPVIREQCKEDPALFISANEGPIIIDEIQYAPEILPYMKIAVDANRKNGQFIITGSQIFPLMSGLTESLAGRVVIFELLGFSWEELGFVENKTITELFDSFIKGSFPEPALSNVDPDLFYPSYLQTYLERDIRQIINVGDMRTYQQFLQVLAGRVGNILNLNETAKEVGISHTTAKKWLSLLENTRIIYLLPSYYRNITKRVIKSPKLYFSDTGLLAYILKYRNGETLAAGPLSGQFFENAVVMEIVKNKFNYNLPFDLYYFRDTNKKEIDLIIDYNDSVHLVEIKKKESLKKDDLKNLISEQILFTNAKKYIVSCNSSIKSLSNDTTHTHWSTVREILEAKPYKHS